MDTFSAINKRASVREYQSRPIEKDLLEKLIDAGRRAPTARAVEPWEFVVIQDRETLKTLGKIATSGGFIKDALACIAIFCQDTKYYLEDGSAATENVLLAAVELGLGACWVAGDKKPYVDEVAGLLGVPAGFKLISLIPLGWPKKEIKQLKKRNLEQVIHWEKF
ncbi:MAG: nitroreductase family protein [Omnitrophica bacterium]|nr:nitroreductase family protein [Candidatus Omnitrophota bacterium]